MTEEQLNINPTTFTDSHLELGQYRINLHHHLIDGFDMWQINLVGKKNPHKLTEEYSLFAFSQQDVAISFISWLGNIAAMSDKHEQACFDILHHIQSLFPQTIIDQIIQDIDQKKKQELLG